MIGVDITEEECAANLEYDCVTRADGSWYHPGVSFAVYCALGNRVDVQDGFWVAKEGVT